MSKFGAIESPIDLRNYKAICSASTEDFPKEFELWHSKIKNQGMTSSCVAHSLSSVVEYFNYIQEGTDTTFSTQWIYGNRNGSNYRLAGMVTSHALNNLVKYGDCPNSKFSGNDEIPTAINMFEANAITLYPDAYPHRISSYFVLGIESSIKASLMQYGPVVIAVTWRKGTKLEDGLLRLHPETDSEGGHCMYIYGWNEIGWKVANSWGTSWGSKGTCIIPYDEKIREFWGIQDTIFSDKVKDAKILELKNELTKLTEENKGLKIRIQEYLDETLRLSNEISELSLRLYEYQSTNVVLIEDKERLEKSIKEIQDEIAKNLKRVDEMKSEMAELKKLSEEKDTLIKEYKKTIEQLNKQLLEIDKPFNSKLGQIIAKVLNWFLNLFKKKE